MTATVFYNSATELARLTNTFTVSGTATDPTTVSLVVTDPSGTATTYTYAGGTVTKSATGVYYVDISCDGAGTWQYVWTGTGTAADVAVGTWDVHSTVLQRLYCTPEMLKGRQGITDALDDLEILAACEVASRWADDYCGRYFWRGTDTRTYVPRDLYRLRIDDLVSVTTLKTDPGGDGTYEDTWSSTDYQLEPRNPTIWTEQRPYTSIRAIGTTYSFPLLCGVGSRIDTVQLAGVFGWPAVPAAVKTASAIVAADMFKIGSAPFGVVAGGDLGGIRVRDNPRAMALLAPYRTQARAVPVA